MSLDADKVREIAHLARLEILDADVPGYAANLSRILELVAELNNVDTTGIEPMAHPLDTAQRLRADEITESDQRDDFQRIAPEVADGLYLVPKVIE
jgi:aspartyl-tRNA(Asn)/glutamyl-tRNA(Gln) amidotransferase subunit C